MKEEFQIREGGFNEIKKAMIIRAIPIAIVVAGFVWAVDHFNTNEQNSDINVLPFMIPIGMGVLIFGFFKAMKWQKGLFESYRLIINDEEIIRVQNSTPTISIPHQEIKSIIRNPKGVITITGESRTEIIGIPSQIDNKEKLERLLSEIKPIEEIAKKSFIEKFIGLQILLVPALMAGVFLFKDKMIVGIAGSVLILALIYSIFEIRRSKNLDDKIKNGVWWSILLLLAVIGTMYLKLTETV